MTCFRIILFLLSFLFIATSAPQSFFSEKKFSAQGQEAEEPEKTEESLAETLRRIDKNRTSYEEEAFIKGKRTDSPIVLELFTMSDCSACVIADRLLYDASKEKNIIALSCHIRNFEDERDSTTAAKGPIDPCVFRQWSYFNDSTNTQTKISVPAFVFNGSYYLDGDNMGNFSDYLGMFRYSGVNRTLEVLLNWQDNNTLNIQLPEDKEFSERKKTANVWLIRYKNLQVEKIEEGVNKGRVLRFSNIIQSSTPIAKWHGDARALAWDVDAPKGGKERGGFAILIAEGFGEDILASGKLEDYKLPNDIAPPPPAPTKTP